MANSKTSLNGYEYGRNPKTTAPFWAGSGEGAEIDDTTVVTDKTWSSQKISDELAEKADASDLANYAKVTSVYTKSESYSKAEVDELIDEIPAVDAYTKTQTDNLLANKANVSDVYTKTETDTLLAGKAGVNSVYTKGQTDRLLTDKANAADVYTKTQTDNLLSDKADVTDLADYAKVTSVYTKAQTYTKTEVDNLISGAGGGGLQEYAYTIGSPNSTTIADAIKAAVADVITNVGVDNLEKLRMIVARTQWTSGDTTHRVKENIYNVYHLDIHKGGDDADNINLIASGSNDYYSSYEAMNTARFRCNRYIATFETIRQTNDNPAMVFTDLSSTNVGANTSPWYHYDYEPSEVSDLVYKLVFVYG